MLSQDYRFHCDSVFDIGPTFVYRMPQGGAKELMTYKRLLGAAQRRLVRRAWMRLVSYAPLQFVRLFGLGMSGATIGHDVVLKPGVEVLSPKTLIIGHNTNIGRNAHLDSRGGLTIGDNVNISDDVAIWTAEHDIQSPDFVMTTAPVLIGARVWLCFRSTVLPGVTVGEGCVVATGAVVTKDVPPCSVVAGIPAKVIGKRSKELTYQLGNY